MTQESVMAEQPIVDLSRLTAAIIAIFGATIIFVPWIGGETPYQMFFDDFYYYLVVADSWVFKGEMSFFPGVETNGFHPLWFFLIASIRWLFGPNDTILFASLSAIMWVSQLIVVWFAWKLAKRTATQEGSLAVALFAAGAQFVQISSYGMEVTLVVPLLMVLLERVLAVPLEKQSRPAVVMTGFLGALVCLSRLDAAILVLFLGLPALPSLVRTPFKIVLLLLGGVLLPAYFVWNYVEFSALTPVSGAAKQLKGDLLPSMRPLALLFKIASESRPFGIVAFLAILVRLFVQRPGKTEAAYLAGVVTFFLVHSCLSDWMLWFWYIYPIVPAIALSGPPVLDAIGRWGRRILMVAFALLLVPFVIVHLHSGPFFMPLLQPMAKELAEIVRERPGIYALGDRAGMAAYFANVPILQTEGLVMDRTFLEYIRQEKNLVEVLKAYDVRYYVTFNAEFDGACWVVEEPAQAGPASPKMTGRFCQGPLEVRKINGKESLFVFEVQSN